MNRSSAREKPAVDLVEIVDFKWLMAGVGHHVHVERMQTDPAYARECLSKAACSTVSVLRHAANRLARSLAPSV